jgi:hypothetical protein
VYSGRHVIQIRDIWTPVAISPKLPMIWKRRSKLTIIAGSKVVVKVKNSYLKGLLVLGVTTL